MKRNNIFRRTYYRSNRIITDLFFSYDILQLKEAIIQLGIKTGDTIMLHSSFSNFNGFKGKPQDIINCLIEVLGNDGNLLMVSMPYTCSSLEYLKKNPVFNVRKTFSKMGIISEIFRRKKGVLRSLHSTHPVLAYGKDAEWLVEDHEKCLYACGKDTPFDKFQSLRGKILRFDVPINGTTFFHYLEDIIKDKLPFSLYSEEPISARMIDYDGKEIAMKTYVFSERASKTRRPDILGGYLRKHKAIKHRKIGRINMELVSAEDMISTTRKMLDDGVLFFADI